MRYENQPNGARQDALPIGARRCRRQCILEPLERRADVVAQLFEPGAGAGLARFKLSGVHRGYPIYPIYEPITEPW